MLRTLALFSLLLVGCDSTGVDPAAYDGIIEVSAGDVTERTASIRLVAIDDVSCGDPLVTDIAQEGTTRTVTVEGIERPQGVTCLAIIPSVATITFETGPDLLRSYPIEIRHAGQTDRYTLSVEGSTATLTAVRTSTTRLAD